MLTDLDITEITKFVIPGIPSFTSYSLSDITQNIAFTTIDQIGIFNKQTNKLTIKDIIEFNNDAESQISCKFIPLSNILLSLVKLQGNKYCLQLINSKTFIMIRDLIFESDVILDVNKFTFN